MRTPRPGKHGPTRSRAAARQAHRVHPLPVAPQLKKVSVRQYVLGSLGVFAGVVVALALSPDLTYLAVVGTVVHLWTGHLLAAGVGLAGFGLGLAALCSLTGAAGDGRHVAWGLFLLLFALTLAIGVAAFGTFAGGVHGDGSLPVGIRSTSAAPQVGRAAGFLAVALVAGVAALRKRVGRTVTGVLSGLLVIGALVVGDLAAFLLGLFVALLPAILAPRYNGRPGGGPALTSAEGRWAVPWFLLAGVTGVALLVPALVAGVADHGQVTARSAAVTDEVRAVVSQIGDQPVVVALRAGFPPDSHELLGTDCEPVDQLTAAAHAAGWRVDSAAGRFVADRDGLWLQVSAPGVRCRIDVAASRAGLTPPPSR